jgi:hypothetical protein
VADQAVDGGGIVITETIRFEPVGLTAYKAVKCSGCGKTLRRQRRFEQTLNPYNRTGGIPKTAAEILSEERAKAAEWQQKPETCSACLDGSS